ncbi:MAG TPA: stage II sporulation protein M, partial [Candidatus Nanoarchaeia archaeon]|nr:stage II sporulation protein M [Candidatus Nanoarchaeia archaeon]
MVLESLIGPKKAERSPWDVFFIGMLYASLAMFLSVWIFREQASIIMVLLTVIACLPLMHKTLILEEKKDKRIEKEIPLLKEHWKALQFFMYLFLGFVAAFSIWYVFLPDDMVKTTFNSQIETINAINSRVTGHTGQTISSANIADASGSAASLGNIFVQILTNNLKVLLFCVFFAFFYGAGSIFILAWNASVISAAIGTFIRNNFGEYAATVGLTKVGGYFHIFSLGFARYFIHGIPEILAYFIGALAG